MRAILAVWAYSDAYPLRLVVLFIGGFAISVVSGMIYKIVPFLAWFHLQAQLQARAGSIPTMKDMIQTRRMRGQFRLHLAACVPLATAVLRGRGGQRAGAVGAAAVGQFAFRRATLYPSGWTFHLIPGSACESTTRINNVELAQPFMRMPCGSSNRRTAARFRTECGVLPSRAAQV